MNFELIDLSKRLHPGREERRLEIRSFIHPVIKDLMHQIDMESHLGTHIEAPLHYFGTFRKEGKDVSEIPLDALIGVARILDLSFLKPNRVITISDLQQAGGDQIRENEIVILRGPGGDDVHNWLSGEAAGWLADKGIKMIGCDACIGFEAIHMHPGEFPSHKALLGRGIPVIENLVNLREIKEPLFLIAALPLSISGLDASPARVVALVARP